MDSLPAEFSQVYFRADTPNGGWPQQFAIVTAYNPEGLVTDPADNNRADLELRESLDKMGLTYFRVTGGSRDGKHKEPGWGIVLQTPETSQKLSRQFKQLAFFWVEQGHVSLVETGTGSKEYQSIWTKRWLGR